MNLAEKIKDTKVDPLQLVNTFDAETYGHFLTKYAVALLIMTALQAALGLEQFLSAV